MALKEKSEKYTQLETKLALAERKIAALEAAAVESEKEKEGLRTKNQQLQAQVQSLTYQINSYSSTNSQLQQKVKEQTPKVQVRKTWAELTPEEKSNLIHRVQHVNCHFEHPERGFKGTYEYCYDVEKLWSIYKWV